MTDTEGRRNPRLRLACARCQRRKIRCDGQYPTCSNCRKASAECVDGDSIRLRKGPRDRTSMADCTVINRLRRRVTWLESIIRDRLPDVDLSVTVSSDSPESVNAAVGTTAERTASPMQQDREENSLTGPAPPQSTAVPDQRAHEIGLISVGFNADQRYIGPSSGYFLARLLLANSRRDGEQQHNVRRPTAMTQSTINDLVSGIQGPLPLPRQDLAMQLCQVYFDTIQPQYPILHEPSFRAAFNQLYSHDESCDSLRNDDPSFHFQAYMVLAISAMISTWRTKRQIPGESYCLSALQYLDRIRVGTSVPGLQCMILLLIFTMHSPHTQLNVWYLNYQCLAAVLDLGLQRQVTTSLGISLVEQELRTRIFWTVFTIDRTIASMMGRPIGLRDEACELRLPQPLDDDDPIGNLNLTRSSNCSMALPIHLFKLAKLNSEIKYVANSIVRDVPSYAYPPVRDVSAWQRGMLQQLDDWAASIPQSQNEYIRTTSQLRYLSIKMLLLRPSPAIPSPPSEVLVSCHASARHSIQLYHNLYKQDLLVHDWITLHGVVLSHITVLYCTRAVSDIAQKVNLEDLMSDTSISLSILSATGEHWVGAKRARDILDDLSKSTMHWLKRFYQSSVQTQISDNEQPNDPLAQANPEGPAQNDPFTTGENLGFSLPGLPPHLDFSPGVQLDNSLFPDLQQCQDSFRENTNLDDIMRNLFDDLIPHMDTFY